VSLREKQTSKRFFAFSKTLTDTNFFINCIYYHTQGNPILDAAISPSAILFKKTTGYSDIESIGILFAN
jgi:hypothetical protein